MLPLVKIMTLKKKVDYFIKDKNEGGCKKSISFQLYCI